MEKSPPHPLVDTQAPGGAFDRQLAERLAERLRPPWARPGSTETPPTTPAWAQRQVSPDARRWDGRMEPLGSVSIEDATPSALAAPPDGVRTMASGQPPTGQPPTGREATAESARELELPTRRSRRFVPRAMMALALGGGLLAAWQWRSSTVFPWLNDLVSHDLGPDAAHGGPADSNPAWTGSPTNSGAEPEQHPAGERRQERAPPEPGQPEDSSIIDDSPMAPRAPRAPRPPRPPAASPAPRRAAPAGPPSEKPKPPAARQGDSATRRSHAEPRPAPEAPPTRTAVPAEAAPQRPAATPQRPATPQGPATLPHQEDPQRPSPSPRPERPRPAPPTSDIVREAPF